ncbi:porin family protein [Enterovibrio coralii]|uniref:Outer membrane protein beta-barrel domain-containing protein n=1 Tax=Enterovibrio coralii TaxID=294935 RepID=A0A135I6P3_9GAMM|nr:porin family protein [Enterovibrio coralii]KXF81109.1 hypothetical protein ATN88_19325 [Enterovibrio coralii]
MRKIGLLAASLALGLTGTANANEGTYVGANILFAAQSEFELSGVALSEDADTGFDAQLGYQMKLTDHINLGLELEFRSFGEADFANVLKMEGSAFYFNAKPKFYVDDDKSFYVGGLVGLGSMEIELNTSSGSASDSDTSIQFGVEAGYEMDSGFGFNLGYKVAKAEIQTVDFTYDGVYVGINYLF